MVLKKGNRKFQKFSQIVLVKIAMIEPRIKRMERIIADFLN